jgi:hypothetical protein
MDERNRRDRKDQHSIFCQKSNEINTPVQPWRESHARRQTISLSRHIATKLIAAIASRKTRQFFKLDLVVPADAM